MVGSLFMEWTQCDVASGAGSATVDRMTSDTTLAEALAAQAVVLDGGMSNQLESAGHDLSDELWSARLLAERPEAITEAHLAYFEAGADVAITSSYQATFEGFAKRGIGREKAAELLGLSVELAREAARQAHAKGSRGRCGWRPPSARTGRCSRTVPSTGGGTA